MGWKSAIEDDDGSNLQNGGGDSQFLSPSVSLSHSRNQPFNFLSVAVLDWLLY